MEARLADFTTYETIRFPERTHADWRSFYTGADRASDEVRAKLPHQSHVLYGDDPYQLLNIFKPVGHGSGSGDPVFLFVHGGGFREGHPDHYDFLAAPFVAQGVIYVGAGYRLLPAASARDAADDVAAAVGWVYRNLEQLGGDAGRMYLGGHSAGAIISAILGTRTDWQAAVGVPVDVLRGVVCVSGTYDLRGHAEAFGLTLAQAEALGPVANLEGAPSQVLVAYGSEEAGRQGSAGFSFLQSNKDLVERIQQEGAPAVLLELEGADHAEAVRVLGDPDSVLFHQVAGMISPGSAASPRRTP